MNRVQILDSIIDIVKDVLDNDTLKLSENTIIEEIEEWDSVAHMTIMALLETELGVQFEMEEIVSAKIIEDIVEYAMRKSDKGD